MLLLQSQGRQATPFSGFPKYPSEHVSHLGPKDNDSNRLLAIYKGYYTNVPKVLFLPVLPNGHSEQIGSGLLPSNIQGPLSGQGHGLQSSGVPFNG